MMKSHAWRGNIAGWLDAADSNIEIVVSVLTQGAERKNNKGVPLVQAPPAVFEQLEEARDRLQRVSDWMISSQNSVELEDQNGR